MNVYVYRLRIQNFRRLQEGGGSDNTSFLIEIPVMNVYVRTYVRIDVAIYKISQQEGGGSENTC